MKAVALAELKEILQGTRFAAWWAELGRAVEAVADARARHADLASQIDLMDLRSEAAQRTAMDAFARAGAVEDRAAAGAAEAQALENRALELVARFEEQRFRASDAWVRLSGSERTLEERRTAPPAAKGRAAGRARTQRAASAVDAAERAHHAAAADYEAEDAKRRALWAEVEATWARSLEASLLGAERGDEARRIRREAERHFAEAEERRVRAKQLRAELEVAERERAAAERSRAELLAAACEQLGCAAGERFLYFRNREDPRGAFAVALADDRGRQDGEVRALGIYAAGRQRGATWLEPAREGLAATVDAGDRRFEDYLLGPRKGARRGGEGGPPGGTGTP